MTELIQISLLEGFHEEKLAYKFSKLCENKGVYKLKTIGKSDTKQRHGNEGEICFWWYSWSGGEKYFQSK